MRFAKLFKFYTQYSIFNYEFEGWNRNRYWIIFFLNLNEFCKKINKSHANTIFVISIYNKIFTVIDFFFEI